MKCTGEWYMVYIKRVYICVLVIAVYKRPLYGKGCACVHCTPVRNINTVLIKIYLNEIEIESYDPLTILLIMFIRTVEGGGG